MVHFVLGKRKISLDQIRRGLEILDVLPQIQTHSEFYAKLFTARFTYSNNDVFSLLQFSGIEDSVYIRNFKNYILQASFQTLQNFLKFVTGSHFLPHKEIVVTFHEKNGFFGGTCSFKIECPSIENFQDFSSALNAVIIPSKAHFTSVQPLYQSASKVLLWSMNFVLLILIVLFSF